VSNEDIGEVTLTRSWRDQIMTPMLANHGKRAIRIKEVVLFDLTIGLPPETRLYGEGFQMLSQTGGTLATPLDLGNYTDEKHYKMPMAAGARTFYGVMTLSPPRGDQILMAFTSCFQFAGQFRLKQNSLQVAVDTEGLELKPGSTWQLEEFLFRTAGSRNELFDELAHVVNLNHPPIAPDRPPTGWCSWYCFGPKVTATDVRENLDFISKQAPGLKYIQIDDGYQPAMGDWLETGTAFGGNVQGVLKEIRRKNFEPAIWVAPFIAEEKSSLFQLHPDWFVMDDEGKPLRSDKVTFGGWRRGPWYVLDGTHPDVQKHFEKLFRTMRREWGCTYFKLDANFWGAIHGGRFHDINATRIGAYRSGMQAILRGAGDSFILGCNHPIWGSLGLIHGSRSSNDITRRWDRVWSTGRQNLLRNWQNGRLWWNDPDAIVLMGTLPQNEFEFHATVIYASGGMVLSGDDLTKITPERLEMLKKLLPPTGKAAEFADDSLSVGIVRLPYSKTICVFNWEESAKSFEIPLEEPVHITDFWTGKDIGRLKGSVTIKDLPPRTARLLVCK
jgi:Alpha-galactosidase